MKGMMAMMPQNEAGSKRHSNPNPAAAPFFPAPYHQPINPLHPIQHQPQFDHHSNSYQHDLNFSTALQWHHQQGALIPRELGPTWPLLGPQFSGPAPRIMTPQSPALINPMVPSPPSDLRYSIVKQIEYYFSDENLKTDFYLISLMDHQGWVPISKIAEFRRVKRMCTDLKFILDSLLLGSTSVEVECDKIRKRASGQSGFHECAYRG